MIQVFENSQKASSKAAEFFLHTAQAAVKDKGQFSVALTGGSSPQELYHLLSQPPYFEQVPWEQTFIFWGDERWVPLTDEKSNAKLAFDTFLNMVPVPPEQIFPMWGNEEPETFARHYEKQLTQYFGNRPPAFDLILLGLGDDGHTASLFPHTPVLHETERMVVAYFLELQQMYRITLTARCLNHAKKILFMTFGEKKAKALHEIIEGQPNPENYPAQLIKPVSGEVVWFIDKAAAKNLINKV